jgi:transposase-like protein
MVGANLNALLFLKTLKKCLNKHKVIVDSGPWYRWALERLGLEYEHQRVGMRNRVERLFRYPKERTTVFPNKLSAKNQQGIKNYSRYATMR